ncbi:AAA family ATPase [Nannocystaceae bacterium ST9]
MSPTSPSPTTPCAAIDELAETLERRFGLIDAHAQARALQADELLHEARELHVRALAAQRRAIDDQLPLQQIEQANAEHKRTLAQVGRIEGWRGRELDQLALDVFVHAQHVEGCCERDWRPSSPPSSESCPSYLRAPKLRFADHFEPDIDLLIADHRLGTIGLVQWLEFDARPVHDRVRDHVDRATYLRHLLAAEQGRGRQTLTVELVLVHPAAEPGEPGFAMLAAIGELLRDLALDTDCLHAIGINLLAWEAGRPIADADLRRAFAWLLRDSRRWFAELARQAEPASDARLARIELDEYRLAGRRELVLHPRARLHLLHGHNGSGKSSLVEALELMLTGKIERLAGVDDYEPILRNRNAEGNAGIRLVDQGGREYAFELSGRERPTPLAPGSRAASFRLDQTVMDRLARASEIDRAAELLAAFFAEEAAVRERWRAAVADSRRQVEVLPERLRGWLLARQREHQELHEVVVEQFAELGEGRLRRELVDALLPVDLDTLLALRGQLPALGLLDERLSHDGSIAFDDPIFTSLEFELGGLAGELDHRHRQLVAAGRALDRAGRWWHDSEHPRSADDFAEAVDEWLELRALAELAAQQQAIVASLIGARAKGWDDRRLDEAGVAGELLRSLARSEPELIEALAEARRRWERRRAELGAALDRPIRESAPGSSGTGPIAAARVRLDADELAALDELGRWLAPREQPPLGERIRQAVEADSPTSFAGRSIGAHQWAQALREQVVQMSSSLDRLRRAWSEPPRGAKVSEELEEGEDISDFLGLPYEHDRDEDAPAEAIHEHESIGRLPITIEEIQHEFAAPVETSPAPEQPELNTLADDEALGEDEDEHEEPSAFDRLAKVFRKTAKHEKDRRRGPTPTPAAGEMQGSSATRAMPRPASAAPSAAPLRGSPTIEPVSSAAKPSASPPPTSSSRFVALSDAAKPAPAEPAEPSKPTMRVELGAMLERLHRAHAASLAAQQVGAEVRESFVARLAANDAGAMGLVDALNELMALFTPARWAYEDVQLRYQEDGDAPRLQFETGSPGAASASRADLRLNTAQLNAFVLALFLLCAPRVSNPLGLLVLDDPLQNMDELTVTTLARGLAKLLRVMPSRWTLMMLFHGEGDLARFHDEVECGVYLLPWLSPTARDSEIVIESRPETSRLGLSVQRLDRFVALRP